MASSKALLVVVLLPFLLLLLLPSLSSAHNITRILEDYPELAGFNSLLTQTKIASQINRRSTVTVLAVADSGLGGFQGLDPATLQRLLSVHVALDYYDASKLRKMTGSVVLTTLFQSTGLADGMKGFVNMTKFPAERRLSFRSAMRGAPFTADFVRPVMSNPYNISVLQVSSMILTKDIDDMNFTVPPPPPKAARAPARAPAPAVAEPVAAPEPNAPAADSPASSDAPASSSGAPTSSDAPVSDAPGPAPDASLESPPAPKAADDETPAPTGSNAGRVAAGASAGVVMAAVVALWGL